MLLLFGFLLDLLPDLLHVEVERVYFVVLREVGLVGLFIVVVKELLFKEIFSDTLLNWSILRKH